MNELEIKDIVSFALGGIGFLIASLTFYLTQLRSAKIRVEVGPEITVYYPRDGGCGIYLPFSFINDTKRGGSISRISIIITTPSEKNNAFFMRWADIVKHDSNTKGYDHLDNARAFSVPAESAESKFVWFVWRPESRPLFTLTDGKYQMKVAIWEKYSRRPSITSTHSFHVSVEAAERLAERRNSCSAQTEILPLNGYKPENMVLNAREVREFHLE